MANVFITRALTGHMYFMSPYECYDNCGTCDGAKCEFCKEMYEVEDFYNSNRYQLVKTIEEAEELKKKWEDEDAVETK